jgi:hypothetical protein
MKKQERELDRLYGHFLDTVERYRRTLLNSVGIADVGALVVAYVDIRRLLDSLLNGETSIERNYLEVISSFVEETYAELRFREPSRKLAVA